ncbi:MAG: DUF2167 domain-containing protein [Candidatus Coatesbacteria bacterium]
MKRSALHLLSALLAALSLAGVTRAADNGPEAAAAPPQIDWEIGPKKVSIENYAEIDLPAGYYYTGKKGTVKLMELMGNLLSGTESGFLAPGNIFEKGGDATWFVVFEYSDAGYVSDAEKSKIDDEFRASMLARMKEGVKSENEERKKRGFPTMEVTGWAVPPHYDESTHNLEWGLLLKSSSGSNTVNYQVRLLGRKGYMSSILVLGADELEGSLPAFRKVLASYDFKEGQRYAEYRQGDKIAKYGLIGLLGAGGLAVAAKTGLLKYVWKFLVFAIVAFGAFFKKIWDRFFGKKETVD